MNNLLLPLTALWMTLLLAFQPLVQAAPPDLTATGAIAALKSDPNASPTYGETYNLGATGLRGWIYVGGGNGADGTITTESRQILITVASTPGNAVLAVDDVILGVGWGTGGDPVPLFTSDARKSFGWAIGEAEKTANSGILKLKRWRVNDGIQDVSIDLTPAGGVDLGSYTPTAPYSCPKSTAILTNARNKLVGQLHADPDFFNRGERYSRPIHGLALLAGVAPGYVHPTLPTATYDYVQTRLQTYARATATAGPQQGGLPVWDWAYTGLFLAEYYLSTGDANVLPGIASYTNKLVESQSIYGTFGHDPARPRPDGTGRRINIGYGPVNSVGIVANMAIFMGKKALVAINPEIETAIQRGSDYLAWYANKGSIPYGEHEPWMGNHESNGKDPMCAVFFGLQPNRIAETEYFTRMSVAGFNSRESGHTGQGFSYLWGAMGANMGGSLATAEYLKNIRWHLDLSRRTDGSFAYDGREGYGPGSTADGTYLGASGYFGVNATASYILTYALPLQRLFITGKRDIPANPPPLTLDPTKVAHAISAATFKQDCPGFTNTQLITALSDFDPVVRHYAAIELGTRSPSSGELTTLRGMITGTDANGRMGACQVLGFLQDADALSLLNERLDKNIEPNSWVRAKAANAIREYPPANASVHCDSLLTRFTANATNPDVIVWDDPLQISNGLLGFALFGDAVYGWEINNGASLASYTINAPKNLLYPAIQTGLKQPDSKARLGPASFCHNELPLTDVQALIPDIFELAESESQADRMWSADARARGINTLAKHKIREGIAVALSMLDVQPGFTWGSQNYLNPALDALESYGDAARWTLPPLNGYLASWDPQDTSYPAQVYPNLLSTVAGIENAITAPPQNLGLAVANAQVHAINGPKALTLTGTSPRTGIFTYSNVTAPAHGTLSGTAANLTYTPSPLYSGPDHFTFQVSDGLTTSEPGTVSIIVGTAGTGFKAEYFDNADFTDSKLTRTDEQLNFDWGTGSPHALVGADTFSARWSGLLLVPETGTYKFSTLNSDGVRLYVNGALMIDQFADQATNWNDGASIALTKGQLVDLQLRYYENSGAAVARLKWTGPSFAGSNGAIIGKEWIFSGARMVFTPFAHPQSVSMSQNTSQAITLSGSGGILTYTVINPPVNGTLTGTAPNLTYTPTANYSGSDSFTFRVNNGTSDSAPATVSIGITGTPLVSFNWLNATSGNLGVAGNWASGTAPAAAGLPAYSLNFTLSGTYTATHNLNNGFQLNQLNLASAVTFAGSNSFAFTANGSSLPQLNQNSSSAVTFQTPLILAAMTTIGGSGGGAVVIEGLISGSGGLTKSGPGTLQIYGLTPNTYSGGTIVNSGTLHLGAVISGISPVVVNPLGTVPVTLNGGTISFDNVTASNALTVNGGSLHCDNGHGATWSGQLSGSGTITKTGVFTVTLSGNNSSFSGTKQVNEGILSFTARTAVGTGAINIATGAKVNLTYTTTSSNIPKVAGLTLGGVVKSPGTYGSTSSTATFKDDTYFSGTGRIQVLTASTTTLALTSGTSPAAPGASLTFTATVTGSSPAGSVTFYEGITVLGTATLSSSQASFASSTLASGSRSITARYAGNTNNAPSTSAPLAIEILPLAPTIFTPSASAHSVNLAWTQPSGATGYHVKRSLTSGGPYTLVAILGPNQYVDATATPGTGYFYVVSALSGTGEGSNSAQVSVTTPVNQAPVFSVNPITLPNGVEEIAYTGQTLAGLATDPGDPLTWSKVSGPAWLAVAPDGSLTGTPPLGSKGLNSFVVRASDPSSASADATLRVTVVRPPPPPNPACQLGILNLTANGGINPATNAAWAVGDKYRLAFVTRATTQATSTSIATYNTFVQGVANSSTLNLSGASWKVIGSTATVDARDNTATNPGVNGTGEAIFLVNGTTIIANNYADLWNSSINSPINLDERGALLQPSSYVFAGTFADGTKDTGFVLGTTANNQQVGATDQANHTWIRIWNAAATAFLPVYALSDPLTIINDIDTTAPTLTSIVDDKSGGPVTTNTLVTYTVTFSEDMDASTVSAADFGNAGTSAVTIGTVTETSPGVFTVPVTPTSAGTLQLRINADAVLCDVADNALVTTAALLDDTTITVNPPPSYATWAATHAPSGTAAGDFDGDGVRNGAEYVLGGTASANDGGRLPGIAIAGGNVFFTFHRAQSSIDGTTVVTIEAGTDVGAWTASYAVPDGAASSNPGVSVVKNTSPGFDTVTLSIPQGAKAFVRLKVVTPAP